MLNVMSVKTHLVVLQSLFSSLLLLKHVFMCQVPVTKNRETKQRHCNGRHITGHHISGLEELAYSRLDVEGIGLAAFGFGLWVRSSRFSLGRGGGGGVNGFGISIGLLTASTSNGIRL